MAYQGLLADMKSIEQKLKCRILPEISEDEVAVFSQAERDMDLVLNSKFYKKQSAVVKAARKRIQGKIEVEKDSRGKQFFSEI